MDIFLFNSKLNEDYLADLFIGEMLISDKIGRIYTNHLPPYMFTDFNENRPLYGRGFTVFKKMDPKLKNRVTIIPHGQIPEFIQSQTAKKIIYTSVHRRAFPENHHMADYFGLVSEAYDKKDIIVIDGEDYETVKHNVAEQSTYYKRELLKHQETIASPISFSFPRFHKKPKLAVKEYLLAPCDPRFRASYKFNTEEQYYSQYSKALFAVTKKKGGWDCMRHYEILACNCLPYFLCIEEKPDTTMSTWPMELQLAANHLYERMSRSNIKDFDLYEWETLNTKFQKWFRAEGHSNIYLKVINESKT